MSAQPEEMERDAVVIEVYDSKMTPRLGWVSELIEAQVMTRGDGVEVGSATLIVADTDPRAADLTADGARVIIYGRDGDYIMSGWVEEQAGSLPRVRGQITLSVIDDGVLFDDVLGWPNPTLTVEKQGANDTDDIEAYHTITGPAETVLKQFVTANAVARLGMNVIAAPSLGRGKTITVSMRMHPLRDRLFPAVTNAGVGVTVRQIGGRLVVDCYTPEVYPRVISEGTGIVVGGDYSIGSPDASRVIVGGGGEGVKRVFRRTVNTARETRYGRVQEMFRDARDAGSAYDRLLEEIARLTEQIAETDDAARKAELTAERTAKTSQRVPVLTEYLRVMAERAAESLADTAEQSSLSVILTETDTFRVGDGLGLVKLLMEIPVEVREGTVITDRVTGIDYSFKARGHYTATPILGQRPKDSAQLLNRSLSALFKGLRNTNAR